MFATPGPCGIRFHGRRLLLCLYQIDPLEKVGNGNVLIGDPQAKGY